jgi:DNA-binding phage protein
MEGIAKEAFDRRIGLSSLCHKAGISRTVAYRFERGEFLPTLPTIGKLEKALQELVA